MPTFDIAIIGAGIAGAAAAYSLAEKHRVLLLERESQPGYHTTGRSAALYIETYGNAAIRALTVASGPFFRTPHAGFTEHPILTPRGVMFVGREDQRASVQALYDESRSLTPEVRLIEGVDVHSRCPVLRPEYVCAVLEPNAMDIDVHTLHGAYLRGAKSHGAQLTTNADVQSIERIGGVWRVTTSVGRFDATVLINAAGAWADVIGGLAGLAPIGLQAKRRTAITFDPPADYVIAGAVSVGDIDEEWYFKPDAGRLLASPADETPSEPCDAQPDETDVAIAVDRIERATTMQIRKLHSRWAGLRSFVPDRTLVIGPDARESSFVWLAGQGGYGIQTSSAAGRATASLIETGDLPADIRALGITAAQLSPARLR